MRLWGRGRGRGNDRGDPGPAQRGTHVTHDDGFEGGIAISVDTVACVFGFGGDCGEERKENKSGERCLARVFSGGSGSLGGPSMGLALRAGCGRVNTSELQYSVQAERMPRVSLHHL